jgi:hypothetical protein
MWFPWGIYYKGTKEQRDKEALCFVVPLFGFIE